MKVVDQYYPDYREILNELQGLAASGALGKSMADAAMIGIGASPPKAMKRTTPTLNAVDRPKQPLTALVLDMEPELTPEPKASTPTEPPRPLMRELPPSKPFPVDSLGPVLSSAARGDQ